MSKRFPAYYPLVLAILFGLAISFIPASSVLGDNITACQGSGTPSSRLKLGGRIITPTLILQAATSGVCPSGETSVGVLGTLSHTLVVSPKGTDEENGTALLAAMTTISNANPSQNNPWLLKVEPGRYYLLEGSLVLMPYVDLEGSGEDTTLIYAYHDSGSGIPGRATLKLASNSEARFAKIAQITSNGNAAAVLATSDVSNATVNHLTIEATAADQDYGIVNNGGTISVLNSTIHTLGLPQGFGLYNTNTGNIKVQNTTVTDSSSSGYGLFNASGTATIQHSTLTSINYAIEQSGGTVQVGASQLSGSSSAVTGTVVCVASYNAAFVALNATCQ